MKKLTLSLLVLVLYPTIIYSIPKRGHYYDEESHIAMREMRDSQDIMRHEMNNHETEIRIIEDKLSNLDAIIDSLRQESSKSHFQQKETMKGITADMSAKLDSLDKSLKSLSSDLKQTKIHSNEMADIINQQQQKLAEVENVILAQNRNLENLQNALHTVMEIVQPKTAVVTSNKVYQVKSGDSLEKIARHNHVTIKELKELNNLTTDCIRIGQTLNLP